MSKPTENTAMPYTESDALKDILAWSDTRPPWLRDALHRLLKSASLDDSEINKLEQICLGVSELVTPVDKSDVTSQRLPSNPVSLRSLRDPVGINALAKDQSITFASEGLTIVYGENGSGKSGYVRILKNTCRSRDGKNKILPNITDSECNSQSAIIDYEVSSSARSFNWSPEVNDSDDLRAVSIFDSRSANTHVRQSNDVAYVPFPMELLNRLGKVCDLLKDRFSNSISVLSQQTPVALKTPSISKETEAGAFIHGLDSRSKPEQLDKLITLSEDECSRYATLDSDLSSEPATVAKMLTVRAQRLELAISKLTKLIEVTNPEDFLELVSLREDADSMANAERVATDTLFSEDTLTGVGSEIWRKLWEAARTYSDNEAYPNRIFPNKVDDELCVLCQQPISPNSRKRMNDFESYVKGSARKAAEIATNNVSDKLQLIESAKMSLVDIRGLHDLVKTECGNSSLAIKLKESALIANWRARAMLRGSCEPGVPLPAPLKDATTLIADLINRAAALSGEKDSKARLALISEHAQLKARIALRELSEDIRLEINRKIKIENLKNSEKNCGSAIKRSITAKNKELSEKLVTNALRERFAREVEKLGISTMPVELRKDRDRDAQSFFKLVFADKPDVPIGEILSEGEHRCVALAAFLAELVTSRDYSGIVFDDPMSSVDHKYRRKVAQRLVQESNHRQVIIFTHDLSFLFDLRNEANNKKNSIHYQFVKRIGAEPGHIDSDLPFATNSATSVTENLRSELKSVRDHFDKWPETRRSIFAQGFIGKLRNGWEQGIADMIRPVISRFEISIKPSSLYKIAILNDEDLTTVIGAHKRLSHSLHTSPETVNPSEVTHEVLLNELKTLEEWLKAVRTRQKEATRKIE